MASFTRVIGKGKNGQKISVNGKTRNTIKTESFERICREQNGDCKKISQVLYGSEKKANQVALRYASRVKKGSDLPKMIFVKSRTHVDMTPELQRKLAAEWNRLSGDTAKVAKSLGISTATVYSWIRKFDYLYFRKNVEIVAKKMNENWDEMSQEDKTLALKEAEEFLMEKGTFVSNLCEKKVGKRGKSAAELNMDVIGDIEGQVDELLESLLMEDGEENEDEEQTAEEKMEEKLNEVLG